MNEPVKNIVQQLFGESTFADINKSTIEQIVSRYPYFGAAQFLFAKKLRDTHAYKSDAQLQKAALYFSNPYWLNFLLHEEEIAEADRAEIAAEEEKSIETTTEPVTYEPVAGASTENAAVVEETLTAQEQTPEAATGLREMVQETPPSANEDIAHNERTEADDFTPAVQMIETEATDDVIPAVEMHEVEEPADINDAVPLTEISEPGIIAETIQEEKYQALTEEEASDPQRQKLSSLIEQHLADFKKPVSSEHDLPVKSSPFHTIDYFASQGIKSEGQDKLTAKVRKFTDWLKQMKGNNQPTDLGTDPETEHLIETIAESSNETKDIVTEAMAEVLVKQGKTEKAVQLYKKLSFLNPSKSTYFAAKIEALNNK